MKFLATLALLAPIFSVGTAMVLGRVAPAPVENSCSGSQVVQIPENLLQLCSHKNDVCSFICKKPSSGPCDGG